VAETKGTLYGIGVGPGDPELITLKAAKILGRVPRIFTAASSRNDYSIALDIVRPHISGAEISHLPFPMSRDKASLALAHDGNAQKVLEVLDAGRDAAFLTLGDPLMYSTFGLLVAAMLRIRPESRIVTIPGITSFSAAASRLNLPLAQEEEICVIISGAKGSERLKDAAKVADTVIILKVYRYLDEILDTLDGLGLLDSSILVSRCGMEDEWIARDVRSLRGKSLPYLSLLVVKKPS